jgi:hypothetical protein
MLKSFGALGLVLLFAVQLPGQPDLRAFAVDPPVVTTFHSASCEVPPWILPGEGNWRSYFFVDGISGYLGSAEGSIVTAADLHLQTGPARVTSPLGVCLPKASQEWRKTYYAVYSAQKIGHPQEGSVALCFLHAENKTVCNGGHVACQNTINTVHLQESCPVGDDWERYNSFVCAAWMPAAPEANGGKPQAVVDLGPVVWPSTGYLQANREKFTCGVNTPSSIQYDGYVYLFFHDDGPYGSPGSPPFYPPPAEEGRHEGIKLARAPVGDALDPHAWTVFYRDPGGNEGWHPSLPAGFTKETIDRFWDQPGPKSTDIMGDEGNDQYSEVRFSVAQVRGADYFMGVESYTDLTDPVPGTGPGTGKSQAFRVKKSLRYSRDLIHWSDRERVIETADDWTRSDLNYPVLLSSDGSSNNLIDSTDFYIAGTNSTIRNKINKVHVHLSSYSFALSLRTATPAMLLGDSLGGFTGIYPNPGHGAHWLRYTLGRNAGVQVNVLDLTGRRLVMGPVASLLPGQHIQQIDTSRFGKGIFLVEVVVDGKRQIYKVVDE